MSNSAYIDIEQLKVRPKLTPADFPSRQEALDWAEDRLDSLLKHIGELEGDMVFLGEHPTPVEVKQIAGKWQAFAVTEATK